MRRIRVQDQVASTTPRRGSGRSVHSGSQSGKPRHRPGVALLLVDVINPFAFQGAQALRRHAVPAAGCIYTLLQRMRRADVPVIYVNDNFGHWQSDFHATIRHCEKSTRSASIVRQLRPTADDYFVLKPRHSGFYLTPLELLLHDLGIHTVILTGFATNMCVLFTAADAHMRYFRIVVPMDCVAAEQTSLSRSALEHMRRAFAAVTTPSPRLRISALRKR